MENSFYSLWSHSGPDSKRDPQIFGEVFRKIFTGSTNKSKYSMAVLKEKVPVLMGPEIAEHIEDIKIFKTTLVFYVSSTAWATQLRFLQADILRKISTLQLYPIDSVRIYGPRPPSWRFGIKHVSGRGPRDTYG